MTYKGTNWTRGELGHDRIRDPSLPCMDCGEKYGYLNYWVPRYVDDRDWHPREVAWICDDCLERAEEEYRIHKRERNHAQLTEWSR